MRHICKLKQGETVLHDSLDVHSEVIDNVLYGHFDLHFDPLPKCMSNYILEADNGEVCEVMITGVGTTSLSLIEFRGQGETWHLP